MIGVDTNVVLRLLTRDDPLQVVAARRYLAENANADNPAFINRTVLIEVVWVLETAYDEYSRAQIADAVDGLTATETFLVEDAPAMREATRQYRNGADFPDAQIAIVNSLRGCSATVTLDKKAAKRMPHFTALS